MSCFLVSLSLPVSIDFTSSVIVSVSLRGLVCPVHNLFSGLCFSGFC